ncbi:MAG: substrate-binding domain-containing protein [Bacteroidota bacterium]
MKIIHKIAALGMSLTGLSLILLISSCGGGANQKTTDTPTAGKIKVAIDDSYRLLAEAEIYTFEAMYKYATIDTIFKNEADVINDFMNDSVPMMIVNRKLSDQQVAYLKERQYIPKTTKIAIDAVALIVNNENPDTALFFQTVKEIFQGKVTTWNQISKKSKLQDLKVVFDNFKSSNPRYFKEKFELGSFPSTCFAVQSNTEVINYVEKNKNAIGVISVNWISDPADSVSHNFLKRFKVVGIALEGDNDPGTKFYRPFPGYIAEGSYPFTREVFCINRQPYSGLAYGLSSFIAGEKGQFIVLHSGMVPAAMPVRLVEIKH